MADTPNPVTLCTADLKDIANLMSATVKEDLAQYLKDLKDELQKEQAILLRLNGLNVVHEGDNTRMFMLLRHLVAEETVLRSLLRDAKEREFLKLENSKVQRQLIYKYLSGGAVVLLIAGFVAWVKSL